MDAFSSLPRDVLRHFLLYYVDPLSFRRLLRCASVFHVLDQEEKMRKHYSWTLARRQLGKRGPNRYQRVRDVCGNRVGTTRRSEWRHIERCDYVMRCRDMSPEYRDMQENRRFNAFKRRCQVRRSTTANELQSVYTIDWKEFSISPPSGSCNLSKLDVSTISTDLE